MSSFISRFGGSGGMVGQASINRALASGMTINQIRSELSAQGVGTGAKATSFLASKPASSFVSQYGGTSDQSAAGLASVQRALSSGMTLEQIQSQAASEGVAFGPAATKFFMDSTTQKVQAETDKKVEAFSELFTTKLADLEEQRVKDLQEMRDTYEQQRIAREEAEGLRAKQMTIAEQAQRANVARGGAQGQISFGTRRTEGRPGGTGAFKRRLKITPATAQGLAISAANKMSGSLNI